MRIAIGCDHRGFKLKQSIIKLLTEGGYSYQDFGCKNTDPV
ncbi:MAG: RpiB/LacA/LacB family sugar-phosphate isomerase, partial [Chloroflexi bacterium]|nr:RpiB/LacA/LacB family sugar-phosphate isomerase [Chloroflexota bacterium]